MSYKIVRQGSVNGESYADIEGDDDVIIHVEATKFKLVIPTAIRICHALNQAEPSEAEL